MLKIKRTIRTSIVKGLNSMIFQIQSVFLPPSLRYSHSWYSHSWYVSGFFRFWKNCPFKAHFLYKLFTIARDSRSLTRCLEKTHLWLLFDCFVRIFPFGIIHFKFAPDEKKTENWSFCRRMNSISRPLSWK